MSISGISSNTSFLPQWNTSSPQRQWQSVLQVAEDSTQLQLDLQSGDLADAQKAYANLRGLQQASATSGTTIPTDFATLGETLAANSLSQALDHVALLQNELESALQSQLAGVPPNSTGTAVDVTA